MPLEINVFKNDVIVNIKWNKIQNKIKKYKCPGTYLRILLTKPQL